jgi:hypothetical protein
MTVGDMQRGLGDARLTTGGCLPETNNHPGIQSATADLMWPLTGFAIGTIFDRISHG